MGGNEESDTLSVVGDTDMEMMECKAAQLPAHVSLSYSRLGE